ncbi:copper chaperone PCu(A)C [Stackebrandtia albiflava]|nr:copper chaperone PCu(A)C [Stackebrandtia albiflava]
MFRRRTALLTTAFAGALLLTGCGGETAASPQTTDTGEAETTTALTVEDGWVKAADEGMTAVFGVLGNPGDTDVVIVSAECAVSPMELHEMAMADGEMIMREKADGIVVPAGGEYVLEPGGDHLMLMDLAEPVLPGDELTVTLTFDTGDEFEFTVVAKEFAGADEEYQGDGHAESGTHR